MPDILTHTICAHKSINNLKQEYKDLVSNNKEIFYLGAQGPDLFFYYKVFPWQDSKNISEFGTLIHSNSPNKFFLNGINIIKSLEDNIIKEKLMVYLAGFLTHYSLDTTAHPYVFYHSGIVSTHNHKYLECTIDTLLNEIYDTKKMGIDKFYNSINLKDDDRTIVSNFLSELVYKTFDKKVESDIIYTSTKDMKMVIKLLFDPKFLRRKFYSFFDKKANLKGKMLTAAYPIKYNKDIDYLNLSHNAWIHPCDDQKKYNNSFLELLESSISTASSFITSFFDVMEENIEIDEFSNLIGNKLYDTGLEENEEQKMLYENIILDFKKDFNIK